MWIIYSHRYPGEIKANIHFCRRTRQKLFDLFCSPGLEKLLLVGHTEPDGGQDLNKACSCLLRKHSVVYKGKKLTPHKDTLEVLDPHSASSCRAICTELCAYRNPAGPWLLFHPDTWTAIAVRQQQCFSSILFKYGGESL